MAVESQQSVTDPIVEVVSGEQLVSTLRQLARVELDGVHFGFPPTLRPPGVKFDHVKHYNPRHYASLGMVWRKPLPSSFRRSLGGGNGIEQIVLSLEDKQDDEGNDLQLEVETATVPVYAAMAEFIGARDARTERLTASAATVAMAERSIGGIGAGRAAREARAKRARAQRELDEAAAAEAERQAKLNEEREGIGMAHEDLRGALVREYNTKEALNKAKRERMLLLLVVRVQRVCNRWLNKRNLIEKRAERAREQAEDLKQLQQKMRSGRQVRCVGAFRSAIEAVNGIAASEMQAIKKEEPKKPKHHRMSVMSETDDEEYDAVGRTSSHSPHHHSSAQRNLDRLPETTIYESVIESVFEMQRVDTPGSQVDDVLTTKSLAATSLLCEVPGEVVDTNATILALSNGTNLPQSELPMSLASSGLTQWKNDPGLGLSAWAVEKTERLVSKPADLPSTSEKAERLVPKRANGPSMIAKAKKVALGPEDGALTIDKTERLVLGPGPADLALTKAEADKLVFVCRKGIGARRLVASRRLPQVPHPPVAPSGSPVRPVLAQPDPPVMPRHPPAQEASTIPLGDTVPLAALSSAESSEGSKREASWGLESQRQGSKRRGSKRLESKRRMSKTVWMSLPAQAEYNLRSTLSRMIFEDRFLPRQKQLPQIVSHQRLLDEERKQSYSPQTIRESYLSLCKTMSIKPNSKVLVKLVPTRNEYGDHIYDFGEAYVGDRGVVCVLGCLALDPYCADLSLRSCGLRGSSASFVSAFLELHPRLRSLDLSYNNISYDTGEQILEALLRRSRGQSLELEYRDPEGLRRNSNDSANSDFAKNLLALVEASEAPDHPSVRRITTFTKLRDLSIHVAGTPLAWGHGGTTVGPPCGTLFKYNDLHELSPCSYEELQRRLEETRHIRYERKASLKRT